MANVFQATTGYRDPLKAMTLKALEARAKAAQESMATAVAPQVVANPEQGIAGMLGVLGSGLQQRQVDTAAAEGRQDLASAMAGIDMEKGPDMAQIARIGVRDPELAQRMYEQAMEQRQANRAREDTQAFQAGESAAERQQRQALQDQQEALTQSESGLQRRHTSTLQEDSQSHQVDTAATLADTQSKQATQEAVLRTKEGEFNAAVEAGAMTREDADNQLKVLRDKAAADVKVTERTAADPYTESGDAQSDYKAGKYGPVGSPEALETLEREKLKATNIPTQAGTSITTTAPDGTSTTVTTGGSGGAGEENKLRAQAMESYRAAAQSGNDVLATVDLMRKAGSKAGYTGPGGDLYGLADDAIEAVFGPDTGLPGHSGARALVKRGALTFLQDAISKTKGSISEAENKLFLQTAPTLNQTKEGREMMLAYAEKLAQRSVERNSAAQKWELKNGSLDGFEDKWNNYVTDNPIIDLDEQGNIVFLE